MEQVHIERLRSLYSMMAGLPSQLIYMPLWRSKTKGRAKSGGFVSDKSLINTGITHLMNDPEHKCGTAACALGWAAAYPEFKEAGLSTDQDGWPKFDGQSGPAAGSQFFGIGYGEATSLFGSDYSNNQKGVFLARLRSLLMSKGIITAERNEELKKLEDIQAEKDKVATYVMVPQAD